MLPPTWIEEGCLEMNEEQQIAVPRWALEFVMEGCLHCDMGPEGNAWRSSDMERAVVALEEALGKDGAP
jgi:hypothetical protein